MARARNLKPGFFKDARVVACSFQARLLFQGLWCMADYMGRIKYVPIEVKMEIFPADDVDVPACMSELEGNGLIEIYADRSGAALVQVKNFTKHQNPHINEKQGKDKKPLPCLPGPQECKADKELEKPSTEQEVINAIRVLSEYYQSDPADSLNLIPDSLKLAPSEDGTGSGKFVAKLAEIPDHINRDAWVEWCEFRSSKRKPVSEKAMAEQIKMLGEHDYATQQAIVTNSISNDYQGLFPPKGQDYAKRNPTAAERRSNYASHLTDYDKAGF